jgi:hypothetical protein
MVVIPQAVLVRDAAGPKLVARSPGLTFEAEEAALQASVKFGPRPAGVACPAAVFACPLGRELAGIAQVADRPDGSLAFRFLVVHQEHYQRLFYPYFADPFRVAADHPPDWSARGELPDLHWSAPADLPGRPVDELQEMLKAGDSAALLGATQALIDGSRAAVVRTDGGGTFVQDVWRLLPDRVRADLWPASFAFAPDLGFDLVALPAPAPREYLTEDQCRDYPEGRYELAMQAAVESGDQPEVDRLLARKSGREVLRLAVGMVLIAAAAAVLLKVL